MEFYTQWVLGMGMAILAWFVKTKVIHYDDKHEEHEQDISDIRTLIAANIQKITDHDKSFERIEVMFAELRRNHLDLMRAVNGGVTKS